MKKILIAAFFAFAFSVVFSAKISDQADAFNFQSVCQPSKKKFSDGLPTSSVSFPPGGGTTCSVDVPDCPKISLPANSTVYSIKFDMVMAPDKDEIGTPYLWVPISNANQIAQIDTKAAIEIARYPVGGNPSRTLVIPGGDMWVANRDSNNVTRLTPLAGKEPSAGTCGDGLCETDETLYSCKADCSGNKCDATGLVDCRKYRVAATIS